jgi:NADPH-dependent 2,4-dienoyl-CoA reductase/sulfur reductase-like enzyme
MEGWKDGRLENSKAPFQSSNHPIIQSSSFPSFLPRPEIGYSPRTVAHIPHVVILGAGFGGIGALKKLRDANVQVALIDKHNYHTFQPLC